jgi:hypothetical protein
MYISKKCNNIKQTYVAAGKSCPHVTRSVDLNNVRKAVSKTQIKETCVDCSKDSSNVTKETEKVRLIDVVHYVVIKSNV